MTMQFFERPILNSPYRYPARHWELDEEGQPTDRIIQGRRSAAYVTPVPRPKKQKASQHHQEQLFEEGHKLSDDPQIYDSATWLINSIRLEVDKWRSLPKPKQWGVTPETERLLRHWRKEVSDGIRPFFCQIEAVETAIWLAEVMPVQSRRHSGIRKMIREGNQKANPALFRIALKMATGAGKTTVMAMLIAWQTVNALRRPQSRDYSRGFLIVTPGITIRDRLRVLEPNHPENYYAARNLVPRDLLADMARARIVITNYHGFRLRERMEISRGGRALLQGRGPEIATLETGGQMVERVLRDLKGMKNILVINDEAHHCYREKPPDSDEDSDGDAGEEREKLKGEARQEAEKNNQAARIWISGIEAVKQKLGVRAVYDLSATPFFLRGSGYAEGTLFPWTVSDFSLMDAIESGIVKLPRVPVSDNLPGGEMPKFRNLWEHIRKKMPKKGRGKAGAGLDPLRLPAPLLAALDALYGHYEKIFRIWEDTGIDVPPVFIVICNNTATTATSKLIHDAVAGFKRVDPESGKEIYYDGRLPLFRNYDERGGRLARPMTLLIDSEQLDSGDALDRNFREMAGDEIERFRRELVVRKADATAGENLTDEDLLREVMNTVGKRGRLGESIRCVVSVSMLTEGWDAQTVTHILGVRAFGTQLLCEQVMGRALRRWSYDLNQEGLFDPEYADVFGIPFDFTAKPTIVPPPKPKPMIRVHAVRPDRDSLNIWFPRVEGYRTELPEQKLGAKFSADSKLRLTPDLVGPSKTRSEGIIGEGIDLDVKHLEGVREATVLFHLTKHLLYEKYRDSDQAPRLHLFGQLKGIVRQWLTECLVCSGGTYQAQLLYYEIADMVCERIKAAINEAMIEEKPVLAVLDSYNPEGSTEYVNFTTTKPKCWKTDPGKCHINFVICDSDWEAEFCRVAEAHPRVIAYVKNQNLGFEVPYLSGSDPHIYLPDFIVRVDVGADEPLNLIVEIKGYRGEDAKEKANTMNSFWVPGVNNLKKYGRWAFAEFKDVFEIEAEFEKWIEKCVAESAKGEG